jgi:hypothetical protein
MANKKTRKWSDLTISQQAALEKKWNRVQSTRGKAGQKPYSAKGAGAWLKAQGIAGGGGGLVRGTQRLKRLGRKF